ncbi:MAG: lysophospholipase [Treponema sp.]|jgi:dienelactone hydrolase|nr:lysophospholipase [Treponema sp.]
MSEKEVIVGKDGKYPLKGILSLPDNCVSAVPAVVLVQGSGPTDKDETVYGNKPFRDIAAFLPSKGIAVLRYDKRTFVYGKQMMKEDIAGVTVKNETIEDAILATNLLREEKSIDPSRVYILGHSLGGMLAPRIDAEGGNFAGLIMCAGSPRTLSDILISQNEDMLQQLGKLLQMIGKKQFGSLKTKLAAIASMTEAEAKKTKILGNIYAWYFKELDGHPVADYLTAIKKPVFILQGGKDFQVSQEKDFALFQKICAGKPNVNFKLYPELNHMLMKSIYGKIKDAKKEYKVPQKVDPAVLEDVAEFILRK